MASSGGDPPTSSDGSQSEEDGLTENSLNDPINTKWDRNTNSEPINYSKRPYYEDNFNRFPKRPKLSPESSVSSTPHDDLISYKRKRSHGRQISDGSSYNATIIESSSSDIYSGDHLTHSSDQSSPNISGPDEDPVESVKSSEEAKPILNVDSYGSIAQRIMQNMGYVGDKGLGKSGQGRLEPVEASSQKGRRGLGLRLEMLDAATLKWDPTMEEIEMKERCIMLTDTHDDLHDLTFDTLRSWMVRGKRKLTINDEVRFCDSDVLENVLASKSVFDKLGGDEMREARTRSNPFEMTKNSIFMNRAAVKMANLDYLLDFMFTEPKHIDDSPMVNENDLLYFADVCAGPGGFSEYILYRKKWLAKGFGFTLKGECDFVIEKFLAGTPETFDPYYGCKDDGNVFDSDNINSLTDYVQSQTGCGVHFMMADGGFSVEGEENIQEILSKQLYMCQCLVALNIVRTNGHFVVKLFDLFTTFSVGLVYLMYKCFQEITIVKPNSSRPANSERYLVCKWKKGNIESIQTYLLYVNDIINGNKTKNKDDDVIELVPYDIIAKDKKFFDYICESNNYCGRAQIVGLLKIAAFCNDTKLHESKQKEIKRECLKLWNLPNETRKVMVKEPIESLASELFGSWADELLKRKPDNILNRLNLSKIFLSTRDWYFVPIHSVSPIRKTIRTFFLSRGGRDVFMYQDSNWQAVQHICVEMSPKTLVYGEIVTELIGKGRSQFITYALHIIDGLVLGGIDIRKKSLKDRLKMCENFAKALNKPIKINQNYNSDQSRPSLVPIRCKQLVPLREFEQFFNGMQRIRIKANNLEQPVIEVPEQLTFGGDTNTHRPGRYYEPKGLLFMNELIWYYQSIYSTSKGQIYYFDYRNGESYYPNDRNCPDVKSNFRVSYQSSHLLEWYGDPDSKDFLPRNEVVEFIRNAKF